MHWGLISAIYIKQSFSLQISSPKFLKTCHVAFPPIQRFSFISHLKKSNHKKRMEILLILSFATTPPTQNTHTSLNNPLPIINPNTSHLNSITPQIKKLDNLFRFHCMINHLFRFHIHKQILENTPPQKPDLG